MWITLIPVWIMDIIKKGVEVKWSIAELRRLTVVKVPVPYLLPWPKNTVGADVILSCGSFDHYCFPLSLPPFSPLPPPPL